MKIKLYVDFNAIDAEGHLSTLAEFAVDPLVVSTGAVLIVGDEDGNTARARVLEVQADGLIRLEMQDGTFVPASTHRTA